MRRLGTVCVRACLENLPAILDCVGDTAREAGFDERAVNQVQVAVDEACANVIEHAYAGREPGDMQVSCCLDRQGIVIRVRDWGRAFEPERVAVPDIDAPLEERQLGGLGLFMIRRLMDHVSFTFDPVEGNEVVMAKRFPTDPSAAPADP